MIESIDTLIQRAKKTEHGFLDIQKMSDEIVVEADVSESILVAKQLFRSDSYQARSLATFIFGRLAHASNESLTILRSQISRDPDWRVQEILAKAFDRYCADTSYEKSLPLIKDWLSDPCANVRRAVTEGLRIWTGRPYFRENPEEAIGLLSPLKDDESEYVRKSVGNALRDIGKKHRTLIEAELKQWDIEDKRVALTYKLASKFIKDRPNK
jgi:3-methyladenine DNA glycosylase AlkC